jgi:hypothetical protein
MLGPLAPSLQKSTEKKQETNTKRGLGVVTPTCVRRDPAGLAMWRLTDRKFELTDRWVFVDREFRRAAKATGWHT